MHANIGGSVRYQIARARVEQGVANVANTHSSLALNKYLRVTCAFVLTKSCCGDVLRKVTLTVEAGTVRYP